jgi:hypothetical protein
MIGTAMNWGRVLEKTLAIILLILGGGATIYVIYRSLLSLLNK